MGRYATHTPTPETVHEVIAALKPAKRLEWQIAAASEGAAFPEYVIRKLGENVRKRREKARRRDRGWGVRDDEVEEQQEEGAVRRRAAAADSRARSPVSPNTPLTVSAMLSRFALPPVFADGGARDAGDGDSDGDSEYADYGLQSPTSSQGAAWGCDSVRGGTPLPSPGPLVEESVGAADGNSIAGMDDASMSGVVAASFSEDQDVPHDSSVAPVQDSPAEPTISNVNSNMDGNMDNPTDSNTHTTTNSNLTSAQIPFTPSDINNNSAEFHIHDSGSCFQNAQRWSPPRLRYGLSDLSDPLMRPAPDPSWWDTLASIEESRQPLSSVPLDLPREPPNGDIESGMGISSKPQDQDTEPGIDLKTTAGSVSIFNEDAQAIENPVAAEPNHLEPFSTQQLEHEVELRRERKGKKRKLEDDSPPAMVKMQKPDDTETPHMPSLHSDWSHTGWNSRSRSAALHVAHCDDPECIAWEGEERSIDSFAQDFVKEKPLEREPSESVHKESNQTSIGQWLADVPEPEPIADDIGWERPPVPNDVEASIVGFITSQLRAVETETYGPFRPDAHAFISAHLERRISERMHERLRDRISDGGPPRERRTSQRESPLRQIDSAHEETSERLTSNRESQPREEAMVSLSPLSASLVDPPTPTRDQDDADPNPVDPFLEDAGSSTSQTTPTQDPNHNLDYIYPSLNLSTSRPASPSANAEAEPSPTSTIFHTAANSPWIADEEFHDSIPIMPTQQWQEFLDSSQGEALFPPRASDSLPLPAASTPLEKAEVQMAVDANVRKEGDVQMEADVQLQAEVQWEADASRSRLDINAIPPSAQHVLAIRRGFVPGFHFERRYWLNDEKDQYEVFSLDEGDIEGVVREVNEYINHRPHQCKPQYSMCAEKCKAVVGGNLVVSEVSVANEAVVPDVTCPSAGRIDGEPPSATSIESVVIALASSQPCGGCGISLTNKRALLCESCSAHPSRDSLLEDTVKQHGLCEEQANILRQAAQGQNIFFTGAAGTGKSRVLCAIQQYLRRRQVDVDVISPTGITALNVGGRTIHSYAGWTPHHDEYPRVKLERQACKRSTWKRLKRTETLIVDEISMVSCFTFTRLDWIMRAARKVNSPFGGTITSTPTP